MSEVATLYIVATPIGNLDDLSPRVARTLAEVDEVLAEDTRRARQLPSHLGLAKKVHRLDAVLENCSIDAHALIRQVLDALNAFCDGYPADDRETRAEAEARAMTMARLRAAFAFAR